MAPAIMVIVALTRSGGSDDDPAPRVQSPATVTMRDVRYEVTGTASGVDLTMTDENGSTVQASGKAIPLRTSSGSGLTFQTRPGTFLYLSAQNTGSRGMVTCRIFVDGRLIDEATSDGGYVIASCSGQA